MNQKPKVSRIKAAIQNWMGIPIGLTSDAFWTEWGGRRSKSGVDVTEFTAMQLSTVWACVRLISETIATLPLNIYEKTDKGAVIAANHPMQFIIHDQPNADTTASVHWEATVAAMLMPGNARAEKIMLGPNVVGLKFLEPLRLTRRRTARSGSSRSAGSGISPASAWTEKRAFRSSSTP
jgi:phage portal protein BeeE